MRTEIVKNLCRRRLESNIFKYGNKITDDNETSESKTPWLTTNVKKLASEKSVFVIFKKLEYRQLQKIQDIAKDVEHPYKRFKEYWATFTHDLKRNTVKNMKNDQMKKTRNKRIYKIKSYQ